MHLITKQQELFEKKAHLSEQMVIEKAESEKANQEKQFDALKIEEEQSEFAFKLMDEGNNLAQFHQYNAAIEKFKDAFQILQSIGWEGEAQKVFLQVDLFNQEKINHGQKTNQKNPNRAGNQTDRPSRSTPSSHLPRSARS